MTTHVTVFDRTVQQTEAWLGHIALRDAMPEEVRRLWPRSGS